MPPHVPPIPCLDTIEALQLLLYPPFASSWPVLSPSSQTEPSEAFIRPQHCPAAFKTFQRLPASLRTRRKALPGCPYLAICPPLLPPRLTSLLRPSWPSRFREHAGLTAAAGPSASPPRSRSSGLPHFGKASAQMSSEDRPPAATPPPRACLPSHSLLLPLLCPSRHLTGQPV